MPEYEVFFVETNSYRVRFKTAEPLTLNQIEGCPDVRWFDLMEASCPDWQTSGLVGVYDQEISDLNEIAPDGSKLSLISGGHPDVARFPEGT